MTRFSPHRLLVILLAGTLIWLFAAGVSLLVGSTGSTGLPSAEQFRWRLDSVLIASLVGAALAASGVVYQSILRNPLADPYLLGISSGASLFSYLWQFGSATVVLTALGRGGAALSQQAFAFAGAMMAVAIVFVLASNRGRLEPITLLLVGVIVNAVNGSLFLLLNAITRDRPGMSPISFLVGGINTTLTDQQKWAALIVIAAGWLAMLYIAGELNVASLGEAEAESLGVRIHRLRWMGLVVASLVTASAVAVSGPIGFVGLVCPHLARLIVGRDVRRLLPIATGIGAGLLTIADAASRYLAGIGRAETQLQVGILTGLLGGPFFLLLLWQSRRRLSPEGQR